MLAASQEHERVLQEEIDVMKKRFFGRSSEKHMAQSEGQLDFFNEIEVEAEKPLKKSLFLMESKVNRKNRKKQSGSGKRREESSSGM